MKKYFAIFLALLMVFTIVGCGNTSQTASGTKTESNETKTGSETAKGEKIEITYWYAWGGKIEENNQNLVKMFNESQDRIHVTAEFQGTYDDLHAKTQAAVVAGNAPEVTQNEIASVGVFARGGMTEDLTPFAENDPDLNLEDFNPGLMGNSYVDEKLYSLPYLRSTPILYFNKTLLKEAGLDPNGPKNWEEFEEYNRKLTVPNERVGLSMPIDIWFYEAFIKQAGGSTLSKDEKTAVFNSPEGVEVVEFWKRMVNEGIIKIPTGNEAGSAAEQDFASQKSAFIFGSTAGVSHWLEISKEQGFELGTAFMPANDDYGVPTGGCNLVMTSGLSKEKQEAAWEFIKWMTAKEQTIYASKYTGYLPSRLSAVESEEMQALYKEYPHPKHRSGYERDNMWAKNGTLHKAIKRSCLI